MLQLDFDNSDLGTHAAATQHGEAGLQASCVFHRRGAHHL